MRRNAALWLGPWLVALATSCDGGTGAVVASRCGTGSACDPGWMCVDERCAQLCNTEATCLPAERCENGICFEDHPACRADADCVAPEPCELRSAAAFCRGGTCHYEEVACAEQAPARPCMAPTGACDPLLADGTCTGADCCVYAPAWPAGSSGVPPSCPIGDEDSNDSGIEDGSEAWSGTCGHDGACLLPNGSACQTADVCLSGFCADEVCCDGACSGACDHCDLGGLAGTCTGCDDGYQCAGTDVCLASAGTACQTGQQCTSGVCAGSGVCCGDSGVTCWRSIDAGSEFACALSNDGLAWCWGRDGHGQLGNDAVMESQNVPVAVASVSSGRSISTGTWSACARLTDGTAMCWGDDYYGQLGNDADRTSQSTPVQVAGLTSVVSISAGSRHTCAALSGGTAWCWGYDDHGQLGDNPELAIKTTPAQVHGMAGVASIDAGDLHTCAALSTGTAWCWGSDGDGRLGDDDPDLTDKSTPVQVASLDSVAAITLGSTHTCALLADGTVWCWGGDNAGQLGDDETRASQGTPVQVAGLTGVAAVSAGTAHTCALLAGGTVWCWGSDGYGQLGDDASYVDQGTPVQVADLAGPAVAVAAGYTNTCAALAGGTVWCWGSAAQGALGTGENAGTHPLPVQVGFGLAGFGGTCSDAAECASGLCLDPLATGTASCWYDGARCGASWMDDALQMANWYGEGKYESDQLFVHLRLDSFTPGGDTCDSGWQPGTTVVGCTSSSSQVTYDSVRLSLDSTGCNLSDATAGDLLATGVWH